MKKLGLALLILLALTLVLASCTMTPAQSTNPPVVGNTSYYVFFEGVEDVPFQTIPENGFATAPQPPEKEGYTFAGWLDEACNLFNFEETPITKNTTLTAKWDILTYTVTFYGPDGAVIAQYPVNWGEGVIRPNLSLANNQEFRGWFTEPNGQGDAFEVGKPVYADASYHAHVLTGAYVRFNGEDGIAIVVYFLLEGEVAQPPIPADKSGVGKEFMGWFDENGNEFDPAATYTENVSYTARYSQNSVVVKFMSAGKLLSEVRLEKGEAVERPADPTRKGYVFKGWLLNGEAYDFAAAVTADITLTASWEEEVVVPPVTEHTVTFVDGEGNVLSSQTVPHGGNATMPTLSGDTYFAYDLSKLVNVKEDITLVVTPVAKSEYANKDYYLDANDVNADDRITFDGFLASWGSTVLYNVGQSLSFTENFAGKLQFKPAATTNNDGTAKFTEGQSMTIEIAVDGIVMLTLTVDANFKRQFYTVCDNIPAGEHTLTVTMVAKEGFTTVDKYGASIILANIMYNEKTAPVVKHTVSFAGEGVNIAAQEIVEGQTATKPADPVREGFIFAGWLLDGVAYDFSTPVNGDITLTASWTEGSVTPPATFTVTFVDANGNVIATETVQEGGIAALPASNEYFYTFSPVDALYNITEDKTIVLGKVARSDYAETRLDMTKSNPNYADHFTVTDNSNNRITLATVLFLKGHSVTLKATMIGEVEFYISNEGGNLTENQWFDVEVKVDGKVVNIFRVDASYAHYVTACYIGEYGEHEVTLTVVDFANMPADNHKRGNVVWMNSCRIFDEIPAPEKYTVTFVGQNGAVLDTQEVEHGQAATAPVAPVIPGYTFKGWDVAFDNVQGDLTVTALYEINKYTVTFVGKDGATIDTVEVEHGQAATAPAAPAVAGHTFAGWDVAFDNVQGDLTVTATYTINKYTVTFVGKDGTVLDTQEVEYGKAATAPEAPAVDGYTFSGWDVAFDAITDNLTVQAQYQAEQVEEYEGTAIRTQAELAALATAAPGTYTLINDLTLEGWTSITLPAGVVFGGNNHTIKGLTTPLFSEVHGTVKNLKIADANVQGSSGGVINNGILAVTLFDGAKVSHVDIVNCSLSGYYVGAIAAQGEGNITIEYCTVSGTVAHRANTGKGAVGGILGHYLQPKTSDPAVCRIENCTGSATLSSACGSGNIGGIVGWYANGNVKNEMYISNCINEGDVTSTGSSNNAGGIIGYGYRAGYIYIDNCINRGAITSTKQQAGGIAGSLYSGTSTEPMIPVVTNCINHGKISAAKGAGGIAGEAGNTGNGSTFTIKNCINHGEVVSETNYAGGIAGTTSQNKGTFHAIGCSNYGKVTGVKAAGGILGYASGSQYITFEVNANYGVVICPDGIAGGMLGLSNAGCDYTFTTSGFLQAGTVQGKIAGGVIGAFEAQKTTATYKENSTSADVTLINSGTYKITLNANACVISGNIVGAESAAIFIGVSYGNAAPQMTLSNILSDAQVTEKGVAVENPVHYYTMAYVPTAGDADLVGTENEGKTAYYAKKSTTTLSYMVAYELSNTLVANSIEIGAVQGGINAPVSQVGSAAYVLNQAASALEGYNLSWNNGESYPVIAF